MRVKRIPISTHSVAMANSKNIVAMGVDGMKTSDWIC